jgi:hypothetical protein
MFAMGHWLLFFVFCVIRFTETTKVRPYDNLPAHVLRAKEGAINLVMPTFMRERCALLSLGMS